MGDLDNISLNRPHIAALVHNAGVMRQIEVIGVRVKDTAVMLAPKRTSHYVDALYVETRRGSDPHVAVGSSDFKAWWIEFGAYNRIPQFRARATLRRALQANGLPYVGVKR